MTRNTDIDYHPPSPTLLARSLWVLLLSSGLLLGMLCDSSEAQIALDGSLGPRGPLTGPNYRIGAELGQIRGSNLFHSFDQFHVPTGGSATFTGPQTIATIVGRVTGGHASAIDGMLRSEVAGANLFLLNPAGVMFGPNATLDVSGSFHVSTADFVRFADGATFSAHLGQESVLTVAPPTAFGFLSTTPAPLTIVGSRLRVPNGKMLSVVGGDVTIAGDGLPLGFDSIATLRAPGGQLQLASVASPGEVGFSPLELAPDLQLNGFTRLGRLLLAQGALIDASGNGGGSVLLQSDSLQVDGAWVFADNTGPAHGAGLGVDLQAAGGAVIRNGALVTADSLGSGRAKDLRLTAGSMHIDQSTIGSRAFASGDAGHLSISTPVLAMDGGLIQVMGVAGNAGNIVVEVGRLVLAEGTLIASTTFGAGQGGTVTVSAAEAIHMDGAGIFAGSEGRGNVGDIRVEAETLTLTNGALIASLASGAGKGGNVTVVARDAVVVARGGDQSAFSSIVSFAAGEPGRLSLSAPTVTLDGGVVGTPSVATQDLILGRAGNISIKADTLTLREGGAIVSATATDRAGGNITIEAGRVRVTGGAGIFASTLGSGEAGNIVITAGDVEVVGSPDTGGAFIDSSSSGAGQGGKLTISAKDSVTITGRGSGLFSFAGGDGPGGDIELRARHVRLHDGGTITASSFGAGNAGTILLQAGESLHSSHHGRIATETDGAGGGAIALQAGRLVRLQDSELTTSVRGGGGDAGNLTLNAPFIVAEGSQVIANAFRGLGGNIRIGAEVFLADPATLVSASSALGISGTVDIRAPVTSLSGLLAPLPQTYVSAVTLLPARCAARAPGGTYSSLLLGGRDGLPFGPGGMLPSPLVLDQRVAADPALAEKLPQQPSSTTFALLADREKDLPRLQGGPLPNPCDR